MFEFFTETTSFMKQSAFQYKIKRAFFWQKKKEKRETLLYRVIRQEKRNEADLKALVSYERKIKGRTVLLIHYSWCFFLGPDETESFQLPVEASYPHPTAKSFQLLYYCRLQSLSHIWLILTPWLHSAVHRIILSTLLIPGHRILLAKK